MPYAPIVILVRPQMGENIGAVARAMRNFGLSELRIVAPRDGWPNPKAIEMSAGAEAIIHAAKIYDSFETSMRDVQLAYATTARPRDMAKETFTPDAAVQKLRIAVATGHRCALVYGPERSGLHNEEITLCDAIITIPTSPDYSSLNLAQSVVITGYEWWKFQHVGAPEKSSEESPARREDMLGLFSQLEEYLDSADYFRVEHKKHVMWQNTKNMLLRGRWSEQEIRSFRGMLRSIWERKRV